MWQLVIERVSFLKTKYKNRDSANTLDVLDDDTEEGSGPKEFHHAPQKEIYLCAIRRSLLNSELSS